MKEIISIKRKDFEVLEKIGDHSFKVERHGKIYFLKKYERRDDFDEFVKSVTRLKITAINIPKLYLFDKKLLISVVDYIEGENMLASLARENITNEEIYKQLFQAEWFMRREKLRIDFHPENFVFTGKKLVYLPYKFTSFEQGYNFVMGDLRLWFPTKQLSDHLKTKGLSLDKSRCENEYAVNKEIALISVKYYI